MVARMYAGGFWETSELFQNLVGCAKFDSRMAYVGRIKTTDLKI
jgi:hypothetical protein